MHVCTICGTVTYPEEQLLIFPDESFFLTKIEESAPSDEIAYTYPLGVLDPEYFLLCHVFSSLHKISFLRNRQYPPTSPNKIITHIKLTLHFKEIPLFMITLLLLKIPQFPGSHTLLW